MATAEKRTDEEVEQALRIAVTRLLKNDYTEEEVRRLVERELNRHRG